MISDPERLLHSGAIDAEAELERRLFESVADVSPPANAQAEAWNGIVAKLGVASAVAAAGSSSAAQGTVAKALPQAASAAAKGVRSVAGTATTPLLSTKMILGAVALVSAGAVGGTAVYMRHRTAMDAGATVSPARANPTPVVTVNEPPAAVGGDSRAAPSDVGRTTPRVLGGASDGPRATPRAVSATASHDDALIVESELLAQARASLQKGDPRGALAALGRLNERVPRGVLGQEREVVAIQALDVLGDKAAVRRRAAAFVAAYPNSPHVPALRRLASER